MKPLNKIKAFGIEFYKLTRKQGRSYLLSEKKLRPDLTTEYNEGISEFYELKDSSIIEVFMPDVPEESEYRLFSKDDDLLRMYKEVNRIHEKNKKYDGKTFFEIINFKDNEIEKISKEHRNILADKINIKLTLVDYSLNSLRYFNKEYVHIMDSERIDNAEDVKALLWYLAETIKRNMNAGEIKTEVENSVVSRIYITDNTGKTYEADGDLFKVWVEGAKEQIDTGEGKFGMYKYTLQNIIKNELEKYQYQFKTKPSDIFKN